MAGGVPRFYVSNSVIAPLLGGKPGRRLKKL